MKLEQRCPIVLWKYRDYETYIIRKLRTCNIPLDKKLELANRMIERRKIILTIINWDYETLEKSKDKIIELQVIINLKSNIDDVLNGKY